MSHYSWSGRSPSIGLDTNSELSEQLGKSDGAIFTQRFQGLDLEVVNSTGKLSGALVSVKSTFDVAGYPTTGGSMLLGQIPATKDAKAVELLRNAGARCVGHTTMTELAYSGLGLNPHYGTPENPLVKGAIPGGSTSGGAVSVAKGLVDIALGTDTGGSLRIPAAFCGLTGFKPSQSSVPREGCLPLSYELDSVGPIAKSVADCRIVWEVLSGQSGSINTKDKADFIIPLNFGFDDIDPQVNTLFKSAVSLVENAGYSVSYEYIELLEQYKNLPVWHFSAVESRRYYKQYFDINSDQLDPRVRSRIQRGISVSDSEFKQTCETRRHLVEQFERAYTGKIILLPTVACQAPKFDALEEDAEYDRINLLCLRNTTLANVLDACSISLPYCSNGLTIGLLLNMVNGADNRLLSIAEDIEDVLK